MSILVFPSTLNSAVRFASEARHWGQRIVGASSVDPDPNAVAFDAWSRLPFIGDRDFFPLLGQLVAREGVSGLFTSHAPTYQLLKRDLGLHLPGLKLIGPGPFKRQMDHVETAFAEAQAALTAVSHYGDAASHLPTEFLAGLLLQAETIHGECARDKILAICGVVPTCPKGDVVEIGSLYGKSSYVLNRVAARAAIGTTLCVDPWRLDLSVQHDAPAHIQQASEGWDWDIVYRGFLIAMSGMSAPPFNYVRSTSAEAIAIYRQGAVTSREFGTTPLAGSIALLHLDGNHDEAAVAQDFALWSAHLAPNGWIIFDDYNWPHGDGPRNVADRAIADYGQRVRRSFLAGGAMFVNVSD